jgi:hypothetical protein
MLKRDRRVAPPPGDLHLQAICFMKAFSAAAPLERPFRFPDHRLAQ